MVLSVMGKTTFSIPTSIDLIELYFRKSNFTKTISHRDLSNNNVWEIT